MKLAVPTTEQILAAFKGMTPEMRAAVDSFLMVADPAIWVPQAGPQSAAYHCQADIVFYGGSAGGGKTELLLGLSLTEQEHSIIFRREAVQLIGIEERMTKILGSRAGYNGQDHLWRLPGKRVLELGSVQRPEDWLKYQGRPHDFKGFDEITHFTEMQFRTLIGWMRTDNPNVRQRVVAAGNPPTTAEGEWVKRFWAAWLDPQHPNPAKPGELRWYVTNERGEDQEVPGPEPVMVGTELMTPKSRTFIPSSVDDNLFLTTTGYKATLQALPEPLRSQMLRGDFNAGVTDPVWQLIPTEWVKAAQARWKDRDTKGLMTAMGFDPSRGGQDKSSVARRHGQWFDKIVTAPGSVTKDGPSAAGFVAPLIRDGAVVCIDSIGIGSSALDFIRGKHLDGQVWSAALPQQARRDVLAVARSVGPDQPRPHRAATRPGAAGRPDGPPIQGGDHGAQRRHPDQQQGRHPLGAGPQPRQRRLSGHDLRGRHPQTRAQAPGQELAGSPGSF
jgi:hypothetical protein